MEVLVVFELEEVVLTVWVCSDEEAVTVTEEADAEAGGATIADAELVVDAAGALVIGIA